MEASLLHPLNQGGKIGDLKHHPIPTAWCLVMAVWHRARSGGAGTTEYKFEVSDRDLGESRQMLLVQIEAESLRIESNGTAHVRDLISNTPKAHNEAVGFLHVGASPVGSW